MIYWIRHAEAEGNLYRRCHGRYDSLLTENGKRQAHALAERFAGVTLNAVYASDLYRARATAQALAAPRGITVRTVPELREIDLGPWEDRTWGDICGNFSAQYSNFNWKPYKFKLPGAEGYAEVTERVFAALKTIAARHEGENIAIVSHGVATRCVLGAVKGLSLKGLDAIPHGDNTNVSEIEYAGGVFTLKSFGDASHLGELSTFAKQAWRTGGKEEVFTFRNVSPRRDWKILRDFRRDAWRRIYGDTSGFDGDYPFYEETKRHTDICPDAAAFAEYEGERVGVVELDTRSELLPDAGHIVFLYLREHMSGKGLGVQLLGPAVSVCRREGCKVLTLRVSDKNERAVRFYSRHGFAPFAEEASANGRLILMRLNIEIPA